MRSSLNLRGFMYCAVAWLATIINEEAIAKFSGGDRATPGIPPELVPKRLPDTVVEASRGL